MLPTTALRTTLRLPLAAFVAAAVTGLAGCTNDSSDMPGMDHGSSSSASPAAPATPAATAGSGTPAAGQHNDADVMFAQVMIAHHEQAIQMSDMILAKEGIDPKVAELPNRLKTPRPPRSIE
jgi:uncharacterized protein (DUF305 family)